MQYKIPIQIENEDTIVLGLSMRQLVIIMAWGGVAYSLFQFLSPRVSATIAIILSAPIAIIGVIIALVRIAEMTFFPFILNTIRLSLNSKSRPWVQGTDSFNEFADIGYIRLADSIANTNSNTKTF